jgi:hypothetical protein
MKKSNAMIASTTRMTIKMPMERSTPKDAAARRSLPRAGDSNRARRSTNARERDGAPVRVVDRGSARFRLGYCDEYGE